MTSTDVRRRSPVVSAGRLGRMSAACTSRLLVLWDVDHTLIETRGVGRAIYDRAFLTATGKPLTELASVSGRTELDIVAETLLINGIQPTDEMVAKMANDLIMDYEDDREEMR